MKIVPSLQVYHRKKIFTDEHKKNENHQELFHVRISDRSALNGML